MTTFDSFRGWFWSKSFWLPESVSGWHVMKSTDQLRMPNTSDLYIIVPLTILLIVLRKLFERFIAYPFLKWCGLKGRVVQKEEANEILEKVYGNLTGQLGMNQVQNLASKLGWTVEKVKRWFRNKQFSNKLPKIKKAQEASWRFVFYTFASITGFIVLRKEVYLYETRHIWMGYPYHNLSDGVLFYYFVQLSFYCGLLISQFADVKRKDFWIQTIHHILTIVLLSTSFVCNFIRVGSVVLILHDISDVFLEAGKVCKYLKLEKSSDIIFGIFAVVFFVSRLVIYPYCVLGSLLVEYPMYLSKHAIYYFLGCFLCLLQTMHIYWFYLISRMAYSFLVKGKLDNDARSETEESDSSGSSNNGVVSNGVVGDKLKEQ